MNRGKHLMQSKSLAVMFSILLLVGITIGGTVAFLVAGSDSVVNAFTPTPVSTYVEETLENGKKTEVKIQNTGDATAYIRAAVVVTWQDANGNIYAQKPVEGTDYTMKWYTNGWTKGDDGFYYHLSPVDAEKWTEILIDECAPVAGKAPEGYYLAVEIISSGIQADGVDSKGNKPIELAWGVDIANN